MTSLLKTMEKFEPEKLYDIRKVRDEALFFLSGELPLLGLADNFFEE